MINIQEMIENFKKRIEDDPKAQEFIAKMKEQKAQEEQKKAKGFANSQDIIAKFQERFSVAAEDHKQVESENENE